MVFNLDFNEFLRVQTCLLIILLVFQGLDYIFGFGVNNYIFIIFSIVFAFTLGSIYHNIIMDNKKQNEGYGDIFNNLLNDEQNKIDEEFKKNGLTDEILDKQVLLNEKRNILNINDGEFVQ